MEQMDLLGPAEPEKRCAWCKRTRPVTSFGRRRHARDGRQSVCKDCLARNQREHHNTVDRPPIPRRSPYDVIADELDILEAVVHRWSDPVTFKIRMVQEIDRIRKELKL